MLSTDIISSVDWGRGVRRHSFLYGSRACAQGIGIALHFGLSRGNDEMFSLTIIWIQSKVLCE